MLGSPSGSTLFPYTTLFRSLLLVERELELFLRDDFLRHQDVAEPQPLRTARRSEEHTSELQSHSELVCSRLLEKKKDATAIEQRLQAVHAMIDKSPHCHQPK